MKFPTLVLLLVSLICATASDVIVLDDSNFDSVTGVTSASGTSQPYLIEFYAPWCGHCKKLEPTYTQLAAELKGIVNVAKVDGTLAKQVNSRYGIKGFPTIKLFSGKDVVDYTGDRSLNSLKQFAQSKGTINTVQAAKQAVQEKVAEVVDSVHHTVSGKAADPVTDDKLVTQKQNRNDILHAFSLLYSDIVLILTAKTHAAIMLFGIGLFIGVLMPLVMGAFMSNPVNTVKKTQ